MSDKPPSEPASQANNTLDLGPEILLLSPKRHIERSILVLDKDDDILYEKHWAQLQASVGLFSGLGVKWRRSVAQELEELFIENKPIVEIYYQGLRDEFVYFNRKINRFKVQYSYSNDILCEYVNPDIENLFVEISEQHMNEIMTTAEATAEHAQAILDKQEEEK